jgi:hypothetical protein
MMKSNGMLSNLETYVIVQTTCGIKVIIIFHLKVNAQVDHENSC